nr:hypothetical protein [Tanacetum cinerariifolium]
QQQVRIRFAVFEQDVVLGLVLLDEVVFEQKRIRFRVDDGELDALDVLDQLLRFLVVVLLGEVRRDALAQIHGFAHVDDAFLIEVTVHPRLVRQAVYLFLYFGLSCHRPQDRPQIQADS